MKILLINGPNLNNLGKRDTLIYSNTTLPEIITAVKKKAKELKVQVADYQSNVEGDLIDFIQSESPSADAIIINPGAFTHYAYALRDALVDAGKPIAEVHISNVYSREDFRHKSVIAPIAVGQIAGFGWRGYIAALEMLVDRAKNNK